jgi:hypothetical protein
MSATPSGYGVDAAEIKELAGALQALSSAARRLEHKAAMAVWSAKPADRGRVVACIMIAAKAFSDALEQPALDKCTPTVPTPPVQGGGQGPRCGQGFHEEFGFCVPDN